ncbi:MAG: hypothetical protein QXO71_08670 [Candidatus Jordarchaeaceae archaeon]
MAEQAKAKPKSKPKSADPLATALAMEKKNLATYQKMEADATKKQRKIEMGVFHDLRSDSEKHIKKIMSAMEKIKQEEAKAKEKARLEKEKAAKEKAAKQQAAKQQAAKPAVI